MEALILILVEAFGALVGPALAAISALIGGMLSSLFCALLDLIMWLTTRVVKSTLVDRPAELPRSSTTTNRSNAAISAPPLQPEHAHPPPAPSRSPTPRRRSLWPRRLLVGSAGLTALVVIALVVINQWFLAPLAHWLLQRQQASSGIAITAQVIDGNLFSGSFHASDIIIKREHHPAGLIDLTVRRVDVTVSVWRVFAQPIAVEAVYIAGVHGRYERGIPGQVPVEKKSGELTTMPGEREPGGFSLSTGKAPIPRRQFEIAALRITDVAVAYADHTRKRPLALPVTIEQLTANPLRSGWAVFDVMFRANATGTIAGRPFRIATSGDDLGRTTDWSADGLPVSLLATHIGGPFALLRDGTCDVHVSDHWRNSAAERIIVMDWKVVLNQVTAEVPESTSKLLALLAKPAVAFINAKGDRVPLSFRVEIDENRFNGAASAEAAGLWQVVGDSASATLAKMLGIETDTVKDLGAQAVEKAKSALEKWRKK